MRPPEKQPLTEHEKDIVEWIMQLEGRITGFPDTPIKVEANARAWGKFVSTEPYKHEFWSEHVRFTPPEQLAQEKSAVAWREGMIPAAWLIEEIEKRCPEWPSVAVVRYLYRKGGWSALDGYDPIPIGKLPRGLDDE